jgi:hypothetical protein
MDGSLAAGLSQDEEEEQEVQDAVIEDSNSVDEYKAESDAGLPTDDRQEAVESAEELLPTFDGDVDADPLVEQQPPRSGHRRKASGSSTSESKLERKSAVHFADDPQYDLLRLLRCYSLMLDIAICQQCGIDQPSCRTDGDPVIEA